MLLAVSGILAARMLGVEDRGRLALVVLFPSVMTLIGGLGLQQAVTYFIAEDPRSSSALIRALAAPFVIQVVVLTALDAVVIQVVVGGAGSEATIAGWISIFIIPAMLAEQYGLGILLGAQAYRHFNVFRLLSVLLYSVGVAAVFVAGRGGLAELTAAYTAAYVVSGGIILTTAVTWASGMRGGTVPRRRTLLAFGVRGLFGWVSPAEGLRIDQQVVGLMLTPAALGVYVVGQAFTNLPRFIAQSVGLVSYPDVAGRSADRPTAVRLVWRYFWTACAASTLTVVALEVTAGRLVPLAFGAEFSGAIIVTRILLVAALLMGVRRTLSDGMRGLGHPGIGTIAEISSWPFLLLLVPSLGARYALVGVCWALVISSAFSLVTVVVASARVTFSATGTGLPRMPSAVTAMPLMVACAALTVGAAVARWAPREDIRREWFLIGAIGLVAVLPVAARLVRGTFDIFEPIVLSSFAFLLLFVARPAYNLVTGYTWLGINLADAYHPALRAVLVSVVCFQVAYHLPAARTLSQRLPTPATRHPDTIIKFALALTVVAVVAMAFVARYKGGFGALLANRSASGSEVPPFIREGFLLALPAFLLLIGLPSRRAHGARLFAFAPLAVIGLLSVPAGDRRYMLPFLLANVSLFYLRRGRRPRLLTGAGIVLALLVLVVNPIRTARTGEQSYLRQPPQLIENPVRAVTSLLRAGDTAMIETIALELTVLGDEVPYRRGVELLSDTVLVPFPRQVWPEKPVKTETLLIDHFYGTSESGGCVTACPAFSFVGEAAADFGLFSVAAMSALFGIALATGYRYLLRFPDNRFVQIAYSSGLWLAFQPWEAGMSILMHSFVLTVVPVLGLAWLGSLRSHKSSASPANATCVNLR